MEMKNCLTKPEKENKDAAELCKAESHNSIGRLWRKICNGIHEVKDEDDEDIKDDEV